MDKQKFMLDEGQEADVSTPASFVMYPQSETHSGIGKFGSFMLGVVAGVVALGATAAVVENWDSVKEALTKSDNIDEKGENVIFDVTPKIKTKD